MGKAIEFKDVSFGYDKDNLVLEKLSFFINEGEYVSIIGKNGSGKSTLAKLITYLIEKQSGSIFINGVEINENNVDSIREIIGIVFQNPDNQFIGSTVEDDIAFGLENRNIEYKKMHDLTHEFAKLVGMENYLDKEPTELSGGQKQRVALAGILALGLKIIVLDEATSMLDPEGKKEIKNLIYKMKKSNKDLTIISVTHDMEEAYFSDRVILLDNKTIVKNDSPENVFTSEEDLKKYNLGYPYILKVKDELKKENINIPVNIKNIMDLVGFLWKLK